MGEERPGRPVYVAQVRRSGEWWAIDIPQVPGAFSRTRNLDYAEFMSREVISLILKVPADSFEVDVQVLPDEGVEAPAGDMDPQPQPN